MLLCSSLFKKDLLLSATFEEFRSKNCFPLKTISTRKKKQELILSGCVWSFLKFGKRQNNCFVRGELSVGYIG